MPSGLSSKVLGHFVISEQLNLGARLDSSNFDDYYRAVAETKSFMATLPKTLPSAQQNQSKALEAIRIIKSDPLRYFGFCLKRFFSFWFPGILQGKWSMAHLLLDTFIGLCLVVGTIGVFIYRPNPGCVALVVIALSFSLLHALTYMDSDGRYRLPAELILLPIAPMGAYLLLGFKHLECYLKKQSLKFFSANKEI